MSAYIVDREHIQYLVQMADNGEQDENSRIGQMLWDECIASVSHRYSGESVKTLPSVVDENYIYGQHKLLLISFESAQVFKACDCYVYQSCEHPGWETSEAKDFINALRARAWHRMPGYDDAEWGAPKYCYAEGGDHAE